MPSTMFSTGKIDISLRPPGCTLLSLNIYYACIGSVNVCRRPDYLQAIFPRKHRLVCIPQRSDIRLIDFSETYHNATFVVFNHDPEPHFLLLNQPANARLVRARSVPIADCNGTQACSKASQFMKTKSLKRL